MENLVNPQHPSPVRQALLPAYSGKKVFVTGHTGFKGAWLTAVLQGFGAQLKGYALPPEYDNSLFRLLDDRGISESIIADIRDKHRLQYEMEAFQPDYIFHLAAQPLVRRSYEIPAETFEVNVIGTANLLEAVRHLEKECTVVVITTDKVYENKEKSELLYREDDALGGYDPYSASKACAELVVSSFRSSFFNAQSIMRHKKTVASARAGNVIGGGDRSRDRIIPDIVNALAAGQVIEVRNPAAVRPWQHVLEPIAGYLALGANLRRAPHLYSKPYNFGPLPEGHLSVKELVEIAIETWGRGTWKDTSSAGSPHEAGLLKLDIFRAMDELSWTPKLSARAAIRWTLDWYRQPTADQAAFTFQQINDYFS